MKKLKDVFIAGSKVMNKKYMLLQFSTQKIWLIKSRNKKFHKDKRIIVWDCFIQFQNKHLLRAYLKLFRFC